MEVNYCPACKLGFAWDGQQCGHCHYGSEEMEDSVTTLATTEKKGSTIRMMREAADLFDKKMSEDSISKQLEKSLGWVKGSLLIINKLPPSVHRAIEESKISRIAALQLLLCPADKIEAVVEGCFELAKEHGKL